MIITFTTGTLPEQVTQALARLLQRYPDKSLDQVVSHLIIEADNSVVVGLTREQLMPDVHLVTDFILTDIKNSGTYFVDHFIDICYKRGLIWTNYMADRTLLRRMSKWVIDEIYIETKGVIKPVNHTRKDAIVVPYNYNWPKKD